MNTSPYGYRLPIDISTHGYLIDRLINILHVFMVVLFVFWFIFLIYTLIRFRARPGHQAEYSPKPMKWSTYLEVGIALFEVFLLLVLAIPAWQYAKASVPSAKNVVNIRVVAEQFAWNIQYPGEDGLFGPTKPDLVTADNTIGIDRSDPAAKDDIVAINTLHVPVNRPVVIQLSSKDVIHSFFLPVLRVKQDAIPGMIFPVWFQATQTGEFEIACAQLCGLGHYRMRGSLTIENDEAFSTWLNEEKKSMEAF